MDGAGGCRSSSGDLPAAAARARRHLAVRLHLRLERVLLRPGADPDPALQTLPLVLARFVGAEGSVDLGPLAAAALLATLPSLIVFAIIQRRLTPACSPAPSRADPDRTPTRHAHHPKEPSVKHRIASLGVACLAALTLTTGCLSGSGGPPASENTGSQEGPVNLTFSSSRCRSRPSRPPRRSSTPGTRPTRTSRSSTRRATWDSVHDQLVTRFPGRLRAGHHPGRGRRYRRVQPRATSPTWPR